MELLRPRVKLEEAFREMLSDFQRAGEEHVVGDAPLPGECFQEFVQRLEDASVGVGLRPGRMPYSTFWLDDTGSLVGISRLRHHLTPELEHEGGHIGYSVRPSLRRRGYATTLLELTLVEARKLDLVSVLVTCDADNVASRRVIEKNGGSIGNRVISQRSGSDVLQFWIKLT